MRIKVRLAHRSETAECAATLARTVQEFINNSKFVQAATQEPEAADRAFPGLVKSLFKYLKREDFDVRLIECNGMKKPLRNPAPELEKEKPANIQHAVVAVGQLIIDLCKPRLGDGYDLPSNYAEILLKQCWSTTRDVSHLALLTPEQIKDMAQNIANQHRAAGGPGSFGLHQPSF
jgi:hypothetical protein